MKNHIQKFRENFFVFDKSGTQIIFTCSNTATETLEKSVKYVQS